MTQLALIDPIKPPDPRRPATLPSLPQWLARSTAAARLELQMKPGTREFEKTEVLVLPREMLPSPQQRSEMTAHIDSLRSFLRQTPDESVEAENAVAASISKLLVVLAGERKSDLAEGARADVYLEVLGDVPSWAVEAAVRLWFRHDCGTDEKGKAHDYKWAPDPGTLRKIAKRETYALSARIGKIQRVLDAREYVDCTAQLEAGKSALAGLNLKLKAGDLDGARALTFESAIALANAPQLPAPQQPAGAQQEAAE